MTEIQPTNIVSRDPGLLFSAVDCEIVVFQINQGAYFSLDEIGADIWRRIESPVTVATLCDDLAIEYAADRAIIEQDVLALLADMAAAELINLQQP